MEPAHVDAVQHTVSHDGSDLCSAITCKSLYSLPSALLRRDPILEECCRACIAQVSMKVNEDGAEAQAVTQVGIMVRSQLLAG